MTCDGTDSSSERWATSICGKLVGDRLGGGPFSSSDPEGSKSPVQRRAEADLRGLLDTVINADFPFLLASGLAWFEVCHGWAAWRPRSLAWWITGVNLAGSVAFGFSAAASYVEPGTTQLPSVPVTNLGTFTGAVCFFAGAALLLFERTEPAPVVPTAIPVRP